MAERSSFGEWLKRQRKVTGLTQEQLALQLNGSTSALRKMESEEPRPSAQIVGRLAEIFNIPQDERTQFLRFARGDWWAAPDGVMDDAPWRDAQPSEDEYSAGPRIHLATFSSQILKAAPSSGKARQRK